MVLSLVSEIGHNWGSMHDTGQCNNNYLMNEFAQTGEDSNNFVSLHHVPLLSVEYVMIVCSCSLLAVGI